MPLTIATCQFATSDNVDANAQHVSELCREAKARGAHLAHFCEGALSGYAGHDFPSTGSIDWETLTERTRDIMSLARELDLWIAVGSTHRLTPPNLPHNSVYIINARGELIDRYDKRFCAGNGTGDGELGNFSPGSHATDFEIDGVRLTVHICHEYRYPELVRTAKLRGVHCILHSFHAASASPDRFATMESIVPEDCRRISGGSTLPEITMPASMIASAASSHVWTSCPNSSTPESCFGSFFVRPDGVITGQLGRHETGVLLSTIDLSAPFYDSTREWRERAMSGNFHSGQLVDDPRSSRRGDL